MCEALDQVQELDDRPRPAMRQYQGCVARAGAALVQHMDVLSVYPRHHLRKAVDRHLLRSPVELVDPVVAELAHKGVAGAGRPRVAVFGEHGHVVPGKLLHAPADRREPFLGDCDVEWPSFGRCRLRGLFQTCALT
jgi:hypothetical protein